MSRNLFYVPWSVTFIDHAAANICGKFTNVTSGCCDLRRQLIVLPSDRSCRDFEAKLIEYAGLHNVNLTMPQVVTPALIPGKLFFFPDNVLPESNNLLIATIVAIGEEIEESESVGLKLRQAGRLLTLRRELTACCINFETIASLLDEYDVPNKVSEELANFQILNESYLKKIQQSGFVELDAFTLELLSGESRTTRLRGVEEIHLLACCELKEILVQTIKFAEISSTIYVYAPDEYKDSFDDWGRLKADCWNNEPINLSQNSLVVVDKSFEQINVVIESLAEEKNIVTIISCDRSLASSFANELSHEGYEVECTVSPKNGDSSLKTLVDVLLRLSSLTAREVGSKLFKHPDILRWLDATLGAHFYRVLLAKEWENFLCNHLPGPAYSIIDFFSDEKLNRYPTLDLATKTLAGQWPLDSSGKISADGVSNFLTLIFSSLVEESPYKNYVDNALSEWRILSAFSTTASGEVLLSVFKHMLEGLEVADCENFGPVEDTVVGAHRKIKISGWLDSALDRSTIMYLTSANEGILPESDRPDYILPDTIREKLGMSSRRTRVARDTYLLITILNSKIKTKVFASRFDGSGEGALLSRLIFSQNPMQSANIVLKYFAPINQGKKSSKIEKTFRSTPVPDKNNTISTIPVSGLAVYKACPYRFYLRYVLGINPPKDPPREIDGAAFGNIVHKILKDLLLHEGRTGSEIGALKVLARQLINNLYEKDFGKFAFSGVQTQMDRLAVRIERFLDLHARIRQDGWKTIALEQRFEASVLVPGLGNSPLPIRGQVDRIDINRELNEVRIYDYKTGEISRKTESYHMQKGQYVNFQMPAYKHLLERNRDYIGISDMNISVANYNISAQLEEVSFSVADWTEDDYRAIDSEMFDIITKIHAGDFNMIANIDDQYAWLIS